MTIEYKDSKRIVLDTSATFEDDDFANWDVNSRASVTDGVLFTPDSNYANAHITHSWGTYAIGEPDKFVLNWDWKFSGLKLPFVGITSEVSAGQASSSNAGGYGSATEGNKKIFLKINDQALSINFQSYKTGGSHFSEQASSSTATTTNGTMYYYQFIKDGYNISWKRYGSIADRTAQTNAQQTITTTWNAGSTTGGWTDTADLAYILIGSYGNYQNVGFPNAGSNYTYDFKFYSGVTTPPAKPTNVQDNSILIEKDTAKRYWFDSGLAPTYEPSLTNLTSWLPTNNSSSDKITLDTTAGEVDIIATRDGNWNSLTYNLGSALSNTEWVVRARINITDLTAGNQAWFFMGMSKVPSSTDISGEGSGSTTDSCLGFIMYESTYKRFGLAGGNDRKAVVVDMGYDTLGFTPAEDTYYYVELKRTSDSGAIFTVRTGSHEGTVVQSKTNTGNLAGASDLQYLGFYMMKDNASGGAFVTEVDQITIHNAVTSVTPATWINSTWDVQDDFSSYTTQTQADTAWIPASTSQARVNITDNDIDYSFTVSATNGAIYNDVLGRTVSDTAFLYRYTIELATNTAGGGSYMAVGMASLPAMAGATTGNFLGNKTNRHPSVCGADKQHSAFDVYNNTMNNLDPYAHQSFCTPDMNVVFPYELTRLTSTTYQHVRFTDDTTAYDTAISTLSDTCDSSLKDLRYMTITNNSWGTGGSVVSGVFGNFKFIDGATTAP